MQVKKEEVRVRILSAALKVFQEVGYEKASLRRIVKEAGTTLGNFYNYFENKDSLYEVLVKDCHDGFIYFLHHHEDGLDRDGSEVMSQEAMVQGLDGLVEEVKTLLPHLTQAFVLLIESSEGTPYDGFRQKVIDFFAGHYLEHLEASGLPDNLAYGQVAGSMFVSGLVAIIKKSEDDQVMTDSLVQHFLFFTMGTMGLISMAKGGNIND